MTNLCVPTASGVPLRLLPDEIDGVRIVGIDVPGFGIPTHAEAKDVLAGAMLKYAREEIEAGPVQAPASGKADRPTVVSPAAKPVTPLACWDAVIAGGLTPVAVRHTVEELDAEAIEQLRRAARGATTQLR